MSGQRDLSSLANPQSLPGPPPIPTPPPPATESVRDPAPPVAPEPAAKSAGSSRPERKVSSKKRAKSATDDTTQRVALSLPAEMHQGLQSRADREEVWVADLVRSAIAEGAETYTSPLPSPRRTRSRRGRQMVPVTVTFSTEELELLDAVVGEGDNRSAAARKMISEYLDGEVAASEPMKN